eukprot:11760942-Alexandrium_andersonii.AAC.1
MKVPLEALGGEHPRGPDGLFGASLCRRSAHQVPIVISTMAAGAAGPRIACPTMAPVSIPGVVVAHSTHLSFVSRSRQRHTPNLL